MTATIVPFPEVDPRPSVLYFEPRVLDLRAWKLEHVPQPKDLSETFLSIHTLRRDECRPGRGAHSWQLRVRDKDGEYRHLTFSTRYSLEVSGRDIQLRIRAPEWSLQMTGYFPARHTFSRWICPACGSRDAHVYVRTLAGKPVCFKCGYDLTKHRHSAMYTGLYSWPHQEKRNAR